LGFESKQECIPVSFFPARLRRDDSLTFRVVVEEDAVVILEAVQVPLASRHKAQFDFTTSTDRSTARWTGSMLSRRIVSATNSSGARAAAVSTDVDSSASIAVGFSQCSPSAHPRIGGDVQRSFAVHLTRFLTPRSH